jgi:hypothetical protein
MNSQVSFSSHNQEYQFLLLQKADCGMIAQLLSKVFSKKFTEDYIVWKYIKNPLGINASLVIWHNESVVGFLGLIPFRFMIDGREYFGAQGVDIAISDNHRRIDVFIQLLSKSETTAFDAGISFNFGFTGRDVEEVNSIFSFSTQIGTIPRMVKILDFGLVITRHKKYSFLHPVIPALNGLNYLLKKGSTHLPTNCLFEHTQCFDERFNKLVQIENNLHSIRILKDSSYLNWRLVNLPHNSPHIQSVIQKESREILGFIVLDETIQNNSRRGRILELVVPKSKSVFNALVGYAIQYFYKKGVVIIDCWMIERGYWYREMMKQGFYSRPIDSAIFNFSSIRQSPNNLETILKERSNWDLSISDSDHDFLPPTD